MKELLNKMKSAVNSVKEKKQAKDGVNDYSNYNYFTPEKVESIVNDVCNEFKLFTKFDLKRNDLGIFGELTVYDLESDEKITYEMASAIPTITATNAAQQLGGSVTYSRRYLLMNAFGIAENSLDPDTTENTKKRASEKPAVNVTWLTKEQFDKAFASNRIGIEATLKAYTTETHKMKGEYKRSLEEILKTLN